MAFARSLLAVALVACGGTDDTAAPTDSAAVPCDPALGWETVGDPYVRTWCTSCHGQGLGPDDRSEAPVDVNFDTLDGVRAHADAIQVLVGAGSMPPAGVPDAEQTERFLEWLGCGAPE